MRRSLGRKLQREGTGPVVAQLVRHMLGDDPGSLFIPDDYEWGLRALRAPGHVVENGARRQLERKLAHLEDGTIAVCGPRGAGKTTLLEQCVKKGRLRCDHPGADHLHPARLPAVPVGATVRLAILWMPNTRSASSSWRIHPLTAAIARWHDGIDQCWPSWPPPLTPAGGVRAREDA